MLAIRDGKLYRAEYGTFEDYCQKRWQMTRNYANKMIAAAEVVGNLGTIVPILPTSESQARPLTALEPEEQIQAWKQVIETAVEWKIIAEQVQKVVDELRNPQSEPVVIPDLVSTTLSYLR